MKVERCAAGARSTSVQCRGPWYLVPALDASVPRRLFVAPMERATGKAWVRIRTDSGRLTRQFYDGALAGGLSDAEVEVLREGLKAYAGNVPGSGQAERRTRVPGMQTDGGFACEARRAAQGLGTQGPDEDASRGTAGVQVVDFPESPSRFVAVQYFFRALLLCHDQAHSRIERRWLQKYLQRPVAVTRSPMHDLRIPMRQPCRNNRLSSRKLPH